MRARVRARLGVRVARLSYYTPMSSRAATILQDVVARASGASALGANRIVRMAEHAAEQCEDGTLRRWIAGVSPR